MGAARSGLIISDNPTRFAVAEEIAPRDDDESPSREVLHLRVVEESEEESRHDRIELRIGATVGRYRLLEQLGSGAMGIVYAALDLKLARRVALKFLHPAANSSLPPGARLSEAQALARLTHPNVVPIFDVGLMGGRLYVAMELVQGQTLRQWLAAGTRHWREVHHVMAQVARGLAAVHAAGFVHRDLRPDNVIIREDGSAYLLGFGLAVYDTCEPSPDEAIESPSEIASMHDVMVGSGSIAQRPFYAPPTPAGRVPNGPLDDQFAYCVTFYEALFGVKPYAGDSRSSIHSAISREELQRRPLGRRAPRWLSRLITVGLHAVPETRHASMEVLVRELERERRRGLQIALAGIGLAGLAALGMTNFSDQSDASVCSGSQAQLEDIWNRDRRRDTEDAIAALDLPFGPDTTRRVHAHLDRYDADWIGMHRSACEATRIHARQSESDLDLRMACLQRAKRSMHALVQQLSTADATVAENAASAARRLPDIERCGDLRALRSNVQVPSDAHLRAEVSEFRARLARMETMYNTGRWARADQLGQRLEKRIDELAYDPARAEFHLAYSKVLVRLNQTEQSRHHLEHAITRGLAANHLEVVSRARSLLAFTRIYLQNELQDADALLKSADVANSAAGLDLATWAEIENTRAIYQEIQGDHGGSLATFERSLELQIRANGEGSTGNLLNNLGILHTMRGRFELGREMLEKSIALYAEHEGPLHPNALLSYNNLGRNLAVRGLLDQAIEVTTRGTKLCATESAQSAPQCFSIYRTLIESLRAQGLHSRAQSYLRELEAFEPNSQIMRARVPVLAQALRSGLALDRGDWQDAHDWAESAAQRAALVARESSWVRLFTARTLAEVLVSLGDCAQAIERLQPALASRNDARGLSPARSEQSLARALVACERNDEAITMTMGAMADTLGGNLLDHDGYGEHHLVLATALRQSGALADAQRHAEIGQQAAVRAYGEQSPALLRFQLELGELALARGEHADAVLQFEHGLELAESSGFSRLHRAELSFGLARALRARGPRIDGATRRRARAHAQAALQLYEDAPLGFQSQARRVGRWLERRR